MEEISFNELLNNSLDIPTRGKKVKGIVVRIDNDDVFIDFGFKSEGVVPKEEFSNKTGDFVVQLGDEVEVILENFSSPSGLPKLSKRKAEFQSEFERINQINSAGEPVEAKVIQQVKGGLIVDIGNSIEIRAFLPGSQIDIKHVKDFSKLIGESITAKIINMTDKGIVISRRTLLEEARDKKRQELMSTLNENDVITGKVCNTINAGAFIDLGGIEAFVPFSEISWARISSPNDVLTIDQELQVKVIKIEEGPKITLSIKQTTSNPWDAAVERYKVGSKIEGKAVTIKDFGVFVELEPGIEGLIHSSEITWTKRFRHPKEIIKTGSILEVVILGVDVEKKRISLSLRRIEPSPWEVFKEQHPANSRLKGIVKNVNNKGVFVEVAEGVVGLVRPDQTSWKGKEDPTDKFKLEDEIDVVVINVDIKNQKIALGTKQLTSDPWIEANNTYKSNKTALTGKVSRLHDYGIIIDLENELEGFMKNSEYAKTNSREQIKQVKKGDEITSLVIGFDRRKRQINLSKRKYEEWQEKERVSEFVSSQGDSSMKLGDLFGKDLKTIQGSE